MKEISTPCKILEYIHYIVFDGKEYIREEYISPQSFRWENTPKDQLENIHTISWRSNDYHEYQINGNIEYYSSDHGWSKDGKLDKSNPIPEIETIFKNTIGKNLIYF